MRFIVTKNEPQDWTPPSMVGQDGAPTFKVSYLDVRQRAEIADGLMYIDMDSKSATGGRQKVRLQGAMTALHTVVASIVGWSGIYSESDTPIPFDTKASTTYRVLTALQKNCPADFEALKEFCSANVVEKDSSEDASEDVDAPTVTLSEAE